MNPAPSAPMLPAEVRVDAFTGDEAATGGFAAASREWALGRPTVTAGQIQVPVPPDPADWRDEHVGWGIVLPERPGTSASALATADDAPEPIQALVRERGGKVLRYGAPTPYQDWTLRDYAGEGDLFGPASPVGMGHRQLPLYLLLYGGPDELPWELQFSLNPVRHVGRLDLTGDALANYVAALLSDWKDAGVRYSSPVVWSVDHGGGDITTLMRRAIAAPLHAKLSGDVDMPGTRYVDGSSEPATAQALQTALSDCSPALIVTTSHGSAAPLNDPSALRANLGRLVDSTYAAIVPDELLRAWQPDGAIWFAQACCSAGTNRPSVYRGLFTPGSSLDDTLEAVAAAGPITAPFPRELLGANRPLRAFIGRVEPTFDWTLSFAPNGQLLTDDLVRALYDRLCAGLPAGLAMQPCYLPIASLLIMREREIGRYDIAAGEAAQSALNMVLYSKVTAQDRAATVILGDPTVAMRLPRKAGG